jgi:hypothetical protein
MPQAQQHQLLSTYIPAPTQLQHALLLLPPLPPPLLLLLLLT